MRYDGAAPLVLLLQGPVGPFFDHLARALRCEGFQVQSVGFNWGDWIFRRRSLTSLAESELASWRKRLVEICGAARPSFIVMYGDGRPMHEAARSVAEPLGIPIFCFEEGYIRPDFVTFEIGGNNANSRISRNPESFPPAGAPPERSPIRSAFWPLAAYAILYEIFRKAGRTFRGGESHHRSRSLILEAVDWIVAACRKVGHAPFDQRELKRLQGKSPHFVLALQVRDDLQVIKHGRGWTPRNLIEATIRSFALLAPSDAHLIVKSHPLDCGLRGYGGLVDLSARRLGVRNRVHLHYTGSAPDILRCASGLVTINSTMAIGALKRGCPVFAFGDALFHIPGLAHGGHDLVDLDAFWRAPKPVNADLFDRFVYDLLVRTQINGSFYLPRHYPGMVAQIVARLRERRLRPESREPEFERAPEVVAASNAHIRLVAS